MLSTRSSVRATDENFFTPVSSVVRSPMTLSPKKKQTQQSDMTSDLLIDEEFDSICDVTMQEVPMYKDNLLDTDTTSLDYLVECESKRLATHIDRGKENLFVIFDPLHDKKLEESSSANSESVGDSTEADCGVMSIHSITVSERPMQVVSPVVNSEANKATASLNHPTPALIRSVSAILTPSRVATERLISISGNTPPTAAPRSPRYGGYNSQEVDRLQSFQSILQKQDEEVLQLRQENRELKSLLQESEHKSSRTIDELESKVKKLMEDKQNLLEGENKLLQQIKDKIMDNKKMCNVMEQYEQTISSLIEEQQKEKIIAQEHIASLTSEGDQVYNHLSSIVSSFNDILSKYRRCKGVILEMKEREKVFEQKILEYEVGLKKYENPQQISADDLSKADETLDNLKKIHNVKILKLNAIIKKHEANIASLQESLIKKIRDNEGLARICDQLIDDVR